MVVKPTIEFGCSVAELQQYFPPVKRRDLSPNDRSVVDYHLWRFKNGTAADITILRSAGRGVRTLGCALDMCELSHVVVCITPDDPILNRETLSIPGGPRLKLSYTLNESEWDRLEELYDQNEQGVPLLETQRKELECLYAKAALIFWYSKFSTDEARKPFVAEFFHPEESVGVAADK